MDAPTDTRRKITRSPEDRIVAGVAGGIAQHFGIDPLLMRIAFVVATFFGGIGLIAYGAAWVALPMGVLPPGGARRAIDKREVVGLAVVGLGLFIISERLGISIGNNGAFWPLVLVASGGAVLWLRSRDSDTPVLPYPSALDDTVVAVPLVAHGALTPTPPPPQIEPERSAKTPKPPKPPKSPLGAITVCALLVLAGGAWLLDLADVVAVDYRAVVASALALIGVSLIVSAWSGRARKLIALGIVLLLAVTAFGAIDVPLRGGIGNREYTPQSVRGVRDSYELAIGEIVLDVSDVTFAGVRKHVRVSVGIGETRVIVPEGVRVVVAAHAGAGNVSLFGRDDNECCPSEDRATKPGSPGGGTLVLDARVGAGNVLVSVEEESIRGTA